MPAKTKSKTPSAPAVDRAAPCYAVFTGQGGYPSENEKANATFQVGERYVIKGGSIGQSSSHLVIEGYDGRWNSVLFDFDWHGAPLDFPYLASRHNDLAQATRAKQIVKLEDAELEAFQTEGGQP